MLNANTILTNKSKEKKVRAVNHRTAIEKLKFDCDIMLDYAIKRGLPIPKQIRLDCSELNDEEMLANYNDLALAILPSTVESIQYIDTYIFDEQKVGKWYRPPGYRKNLVVAMTALLAMICTSLSPAVNEESLSQSLLESSGLVLFLHLILICSSSLLGVMFYSLKAMNDKIKNYTLTKVDVLEFDSTILVGVISGFLVSEVFYGTIMPQLKDSVFITKIMLAIIGGFSSDAMFSVIQGVVEKIKSLFIG